MTISLFVLLDGGRIYYTGSTYEQVLNYQSTNENYSKFKIIELKGEY